MFYLISILLLLMPFATSAQSDSLVIALWPKGAPVNNIITTPQSIDERGVISHSSEAKLTIFPAHAKKNRQAAMLIIPGGGYFRVAMDHEGYQYARRLQAEGITAAVLQYRIPTMISRIPMDDAEEAMRILHSLSSKYKFKKKRIAVSGFSAGGHLAATLSNHARRELRPAASVLVYPVISFRSPYGHKGSCENLLGTSPTEKELAHFSLDEQVNKQTPPALLLHSTNDRAVPIENSERYIARLQAFGIPNMFITYPSGGHGWGMRSNGVTDGWVDHVILFLDTHL